MKQLLFITLTILSILLCQSCAREDDIQEIFVSKTWFILGGKLNGEALNSEVSNFYHDKGGNMYGTLAYNIHFSTGNTFTCVLAPNVKFSGTYTVDGRKQLLHLNIKEGAIPSTVFDRNIYQVLRNITYYEGDKYVLNIHQDKNNFLRLNYER